MAGFERTNVGASEGGEAQRAADADSAQRHYQAGLAALEKNDLAAAEEEMQAAVKLAPKNALIRYKLAVVQSKRDEWQPALKNIDAAQKLGLPKSMEDEARRLSADVIMKQLQANVAESRKFDQLSWLRGKYIFTKTLDHDSECTKDHHWISNVLNIQPDYDKGVLSGTLTIHGTHRVSRTGASGCADATASVSGSKSEDGAKPESKSESNSESKPGPKLELSRDASLQVVIKPDDGINDGKIRMFATLQSCTGNACDTLDRETVYIAEKEGGSPMISVSVLSDGDKDGRMDEKFREQRPNRF
jgi:hypothetical protein